MVMTQLGQGPILIGVAVVVLVVIAVMLLWRRTGTEPDEEGSRDEMLAAAETTGSTSRADEVQTGTWGGIVIRGMPGDGESSPRKPYAESPDILPMGLQPLGDPTTLTTPESYAIDVGGAVCPGQPNYLYLRGRNTTASDVFGSWNLFWAPRNLLLYPDLWQDNQLAAASGGGAPALTIAAGAVGVSSDPFLWLPPIAPGMDDPFSLIAVATTPALDNPLVGVTGISGLAQALASNANIAQRSLRYFPGNAPLVWDTAYYAHGSEPATVMFVMEFENMPGGSSFTLTTDTPFDGRPPTLTGSAPAGISNSNWGPFPIPAGWASTFSYTVNLGSDRSTIPVGLQSKVTLCAYLIQGTDYGPGDLPATVATHAEGADPGVAPLQAILVGSVSAVLLAEV